MMVDMQNKIHLITSSLVGKFHPKTSSTIVVQKNQTPVISPSKTDFSYKHQKDSGKTQKNKQF